MAKPTESKQIRRLQRRLKALELRAQGMTYRQIATELGYKNGVKEAFVAVKEGLAYIEDEMRMTARDYVAFSLLQLDRLLDAAMPYALGLPHTESFVDPDTGEVIEQTVRDAPNWQAARLVVDIIMDRIKILGLDAPQRIHIDAATAAAPELLVKKLIQLRRNISDDLPDDGGPGSRP